MSAYDTPQQECPYCKNMMDADWVDNGVGMVQCGPYHCHACGASEIGPELDNYYYKDRDGNTIYLQSKRVYWKTKRKGQRRKRHFTNYNNAVLRPGAPFTQEEINTGFYKGRISPYANTVNGVLVDHVTAKSMYKIGLLDEKDIPNHK